MKTVLLTGASGLIGIPLVKFLLEHDFRVIGVVGSAEGLARVSATVSYEHKKNFFGFQCDLLEPNAVHAVLQFLDYNRLAVDVLVNGARSVSNLSAKESLSYDLDSAAREFALGVSIPAQLSLCLAEAMCERGFGSIVNIGSIYGEVVPTPALYDSESNRPPIYYGVVKAALCKLTQELAARLARSGVAVNMLSIGGVRGRASPEFGSRYSAICPSGKMIEPEEIGPAMFGFLNCENANLTGQILYLDGGWILT